MARHPYLKRLGKELDNHPAVNHPLFDKIEDFSIEQTRLFASQFYLYVRMFPRLMGAIVYAVPDEKARFPLVLNLLNETGGIPHLNKNDQSHAHPALFRRFTQSLGISDKKLEATKPLPSTKKFIDTYIKLYLHSPFIKAMGAVGPGTECPVPKMYVPILNGLRKQKRFSDHDLYFFALHLPIDKEHCDMICESLSPYMTSTKNQKLVRKGAIEALNARKKFWDGIALELS